MIAESTMNGLNASVYLKAKNAPSRRQGGVRQYNIYGHHANHPHQIRCAADTRCYNTSNEQGDVYIAGISSSGSASAASIATGHFVAGNLWNGPYGTDAAAGDYLSASPIELFIPLFSTPAMAAASPGSVGKLLNDIQSMRDGWDGAGSIAPNANIKLAAMNVIAQISAFVASAEIEVDPTEGTVVFRWFSDDHNSSISLTLLRSGGGIIFRAIAGENGEVRQVARDAVSHVGRILMDVGLGKICDPVR